MFEYKYVTYIDRFIIKEVDEMIKAIDKRRVFCLAHYIKPQNDERYVQLVERLRSLLMSPLLTEEESLNILNNTPDLWS